MVDKIVIIKSIEESIEKCSKPHISNLPGDLRSNDIKTLKERKYELLERVNQADKDYEESLKKSEELKKDIEKLNNDKKEVTNILKKTESLRDREERNFNYHLKNISESSNNVSDALYYDPDMPERDLDYQEVESVFQSNGIKSYFYKIDALSGNMSYRCKQLSSMFENYIKTREPIDKKFLNKLASDSKKLYNNVSKAYSKQKHGYAIGRKFVDDARELYNNLEDLKGNYKSHGDYEKQIKKVSRQLNNINKQIKKNENAVKKQDKESINIKNLIDDYETELSKLASKGI